MKRRYLSVIIAATLMLSLAACSGSSADESSSGGNTTTDTAESTANSGDSEASDEEEVSEDIEEEETEVSADSAEEEIAEDDDEDYDDADLAPNTDEVYTLDDSGDVYSYSDTVNIAVPSGHIYDEENSQSNILYFYSNTDDNNEGNTCVLYELWGGRTEEDMENLYSGEYQYMEESDIWDVTVGDVQEMAVSGREVHYIVIDYTYKEEGHEYNGIEYYAWTFLTDTMPMEVHATETYYGSEPEVYTDGKALLRALFLAIQD